MVLHFFIFLQSNYKGAKNALSSSQEEDLRHSSDPKFGHLSEDLHVEITAFAPPAEAHARLAYALTEVRKYLIPGEDRFNVT